MFCELAPNPKLFDLIKVVTCYLNVAIIPLIFSLAIVAFIWGIFQFVINTDSETAKSKGRDFIVWSVIGLAVMFSIFGLVRILGKTFGIETVIPQLKQ